MTKQPADGYTLLWTANTPIITTPVTQPASTPYDPVKDFTNISKLLVGVTTAAVPSSLPVNSLKEFVEYAKRNPGKLSFASVGIGSSQHIDGEVLKLRAGIDMIHVPYKGFGQVLPDLVAGRVDLAFIAYLSAVQQLNSGKLKVLAVTQHYARMPDKPTYEEAVARLRSRAELERLDARTGRDAQAGAEPDLRFAVEGARSRHRAAKRNSRTRATSSPSIRPKSSPTK